MLQDEVLESLAGRAAEGALIHVQLDLVVIKVIERLAEIVDECSGLLGLDHYVVDIDLHIATDLALQACLHASLICGMSWYCTADATGGSLRRGSKAT